LLCLSSVQKVELNTLLTPSMTSSTHQECESAPPAFGAEAQAVSKHINSCNHCLFAIAGQRQSLLVAGCPECQRLLSGFRSEGSPVSALHFTEEMIENHHFGRLNELEVRLFDVHAQCCNTCATELHNHRLFIYALQAALSTPLPLYENRGGATFRSASAA
jgi:hypothetical protein